MNKLQRLNKKIVISTVALILAATAFLASVCYAWFVAGQNSQISGTEAQVVGESLKFASVSAVKNYTVYNEKGTSEIKVIKYTYTLGNGKIKYESQTPIENGTEGTEDTTTKDDVYNKTTGDNEDLSPLFSGLSSGDYVDITFSFYSKSTSLAGRGWELSLTNFGTGGDNTFQLKSGSNSGDEGTKYGLLGAFQWGACEGTTFDSTKATLKYFHNEVITGTSENTLNVFNYYDNNTDNNSDDDKDDSAYSVTVAKGTFPSDTTQAGFSEDSPIYVTLRIMADIGEFSKLTEQKGTDSNEDISQYFNNTVFEIGKIVLIEKTDTTDTTTSGG